ncbi:MAG TPA: elongation factor P [Phycisphaerae bacterium]|nr:elongation factor P [Phycisphaerae bacterium]
MSLAEGLHKGMIIRHEGHLYTIVDYHIARTGKQRPTVHVKLRSLASGKPADRTLDELGKVEEVPHENRPMQYLYTAGREYVFMDAETFEQYPVSDELLDKAVDFLVEQETYRFQIIEGNIAAIQLPDIVALEVTDTAPVEHAGGSTSVQKEAKLASGIVVQVPLFIKNGERIRVNTETRQYEGKEH